MNQRTNWLQLVLHDEGQSEYADVKSHHHRVDLLGKVTSLVSMGLVGFVVVASAVGLAESRPAVADANASLRQRVVEAQAAAATAEVDYRRARALLRATQAAIRPDIGGELSALLDQQTVVAAYVGLQGPGLTLTVDNSEQPTFSGTTDLGQVIDRDLQQAVNGLWRAGAEAISINGIRLTSRTSIRNAGSTILVDYRPVTPPYRIRALGASADLSRDFRQTPEWTELQQLRDRYGIRWGIAASRSLQVPAGVSTLPKLATAGGDL